MIDMKGLNQVDNINDIDLQEKLLNESHIGFRIYQTCDVYSEPTDPTETPELLYPAGWYEVQNNEDETAQEFILIEGASNLEEVEVDKAEDVNGYVHRYGNHIEFYFTASSDTEIKDIVTSMPKPKTASEFVATCSTTNPSSTDIVKLDGLGKLSFLNEGHKDFVVKGSYFSIDYDPAQGWAIDHKVEEIKVGDIRVFANCSGQAVDGWLECNGAEVSKTTYADLYAVVQDRFEDPDNPCQAGNFRLPNIDDLDTKMPSFIRWKVTEVNTQGVVALRDLADVDCANLQDGTPLCWNAERSRWETMPGESVIIGDVRAFAFNAAPDGWLPCNGQAFDKDEYPDLFKVINYSFGTSTDGDPLLPDLNSGRFIEGGTGVGAAGYKDAGLPNLTGHIGSGLLSTNNTTEVSGTGILSGTSSTREQNYDNGTGYHQKALIDIDASKGGTDLVYGKSSTVQPKSAQMFYCIRAVATHTEGEVKVISTYECVNLTSTVTWGTAIEGSCFQTGNIVHVSFMQGGPNPVAPSGLPKSLKGVRVGGTSGASGSTVYTSGASLPAGSGTMSYVQIGGGGYAYFCFSYITDSYTPVIPAYDHLPVDGETLIYSGENKRWELGPATSFTTTNITDSLSHGADWDKVKVLAIQTGNIVSITVSNTSAYTSSTAKVAYNLPRVKGLAYGDMISTRCTVKTSTGRLVIEESAPGEGTTLFYAGYDVANNNATITYITDSYTPAMPVYNKTPEDGDILRFNGTDNKWNLENIISIPKVSTAGKVLTSKSDGTYEWLDGSPDSYNIVNKITGYETRALSTVRGQLFKTMLSSTTTTETYRVYGDVWFIGHSVWKQNSIFANIPAELQPGVDKVIGTIYSYEDGSDMTTAHKEKAYAYNNKWRVESTTENPSVATIAAGLNRIVVNYTMTVNK